MYIFIAQIIWFGLSALVIVADRKLLATAAAPVDVENYDLTDRSIWQYLILQVLFGGLVIPFYLWNSRRTATAALIGVGLMVVCGAIAYYAMQALIPQPHSMIMMEIHPA